MITSTEPITLTDGRFDAEGDDQSWWTTMGPGFALTHVFLGDPVSGPFVQVGRADELPEGPVHYHRTDSFRIVLDGATDVGRTTYRTGHFRLQPAGRHYGPEVGTEPHTLLTAFADRRGFEVFPAKEDYREGIAMMMEMVRGLYGDAVPEIFPRESSGTSALSTAPPLSMHANHIDGSFDDADTWPAVAPGVRGAVLGLGHNDAGPAVLLSRADPDAALVGGAGDRVRCVLVGTLVENERRFGAGSFSLLEAEATAAAGIAGERGVDLVEILASRSALDGASPWHELVGDLEEAT